MDQLKKRNKNKNKNGQKISEVNKMQNLSKFNDWSQVNSGYFAKRSAQSYIAGLQGTVGAAGACGSSCGAGDDKKLVPKPSACGSSCCAGGN